MRKLIVPVLLAAALLALVVAAPLALLVKVDAQQPVVLTQSGRVVATLTEPGLHRRWPAPWQHAVRVDLRGRTTELALPEQGALLRRLAVRWHVSDPAAFVAGGGDAQTGKHLAIAFAGASFANGRGPSPAERQAAAAALAPVGIAVDDAWLTQAVPAGELSALVDATATQLRQQAADLHAQAETEPARIRSRAGTERDALIAAGWRDAQRLRADGDAQAAKIYAQAFGRQPDFARFWRSMEVYRLAFGGSGVADQRRELLVLAPSPEFLRDLAGPQSRGAAPTTRAKALK